MERDLFFISPLNDDDLKKRNIEREQQDVRTAYFRDATAIIHSSPFRRLKHKTQVFFAPKNDHICTRMEHVMHVSTISNVICRSLGLDADLAWAIGLGHDLGHAPFGHIGEEILSEVLQEEHSSRTFKHEIYGLRVVDKLVAKGKGLNLTYAVRDGIITHCGEKFEQAIEPDLRIKPLESITERNFYPSTWEGCVMRMSDKIAYLGRDFEDAVTLGIIRAGDLPSIVQTVLGNTNANIINTLTTDMIITSEQTGKIGFSDTIFEAFTVLRKFNYESIYYSPELTRFNIQLKKVLRTLYQHLLESIDKYKLEFHLYKESKLPLDQRFGNYLESMHTLYIAENNLNPYAALDFIAGMTDNFALDTLEELIIPQRFK
ncbi:HD domain-containing protein [Entomospira nematocerorum]|uniref:HD domain-containing protein n=1 Tax=Entomospira nematocerorum TaxID=2719987 RepID=A0A968KU30_9SPIO|nr:HD domain-containing protein [Entomospira nematocera]NIZ46819.1 HD domain-containing protein [Entomospira nematocera]WDI33384.1 HD domain-containing protein [Entomospira nematocera]